jgi:hypothetical protein
MQCAITDNRIMQEKSKMFKEFAFDHVLGPAATQEDVFKSCNVDKLIDKVVEGYHATIFAYGQTGAGKTHSMDGYTYVLGENGTKPVIEVERGQDQEHVNAGITPRAIGYLFQRLGEEAAKGGRKYSVYTSYLQIYNEKIFDLLNPSQLAQGSGLSTSGLKMRFKEGTFVVDNLYTFECKNRQDVLDLFHFGLQNRVVAAHKLNHASSRSHSILTLTLDSVDPLNPVPSHSKEPRRIT